MPEVLACNAQYNWGYSYNPSHDVVEKMGQETDPLPYMWADGVFLNTGTTGITDVNLVRRMIWWALSSGSKGCNVGDNQMWTWPSSALAEVTANTFYTSQVPTISTYFQSLPDWHLLAADTASQLSTAGRGTHVSPIASGGSGTPYLNNSDSYVTASSTPGGTLGGHLHESPLDHHRRRGADGRWVHGHLGRPAEGTTSAATPGTTYDSGSQGTNSVGDVDWVLVLNGSTGSGSEPPDTSITGGPAEGSTTNDNAPTFDFTSTEAGSTFQCRFDLAAFAACASPFTTATLSDGSHGFEVRAIDGEGNVDLTPASRSFTIDTVPPETAITSDPGSLTDDDTPTFTFTATEEGSVFRCLLDVGADAATTTPTAALDTTPARAAGAPTSSSTAKRDLTVGPGEDAFVVRQIGHGDHSTRPSSPARRPMSGARSEPSRHHQFRQPLMPQQSWSSVIE